MEFSVSDLAIARGGRIVLTGVSFHVFSGHGLILRGPNGVGKTTLLRTIAGLQRPMHGKIHCPADQIAYAGHADGIKGALSVWENLHFWAQIFGSNAAHAAMHDFDLAALAMRRATDLSAGQKRRLSLARLRVTNRPIWLLDEPTISLDAHSSRLFQSVMRAHLQSGGIAVMATHIDLGLPEVGALSLQEFIPGPEAALHDSDAAFL